MSQPTFALWLVVKHILRYLIGFFYQYYFTNGWFSSSSSLFGCSASCLDDKKSPHGYCVFLRPNLVFSSLLGNGLFQGVVLN